MTIRPLLTVFCLALVLTGCVASRPADIADICQIFEERRDWYLAAKRTEDRWGVPAPVSMAILFQESGFRARARPARRNILWVIPGPRPSTAYGYAQAVDSTWADYVSDSGNWSARRDNFADAIDFVGWYNAMSGQLNHIPSDDAARLYFAYHEGNAGFAQGSHQRKPWLLQTGSRVQENAARFGLQYEGCRAELEKNWFQRLFS
jgi:hypothetical protein